MIKQVIVMRKDLNMRKGKMIAQGAHASLAVFLKTKKKVETVHHLTSPVSISAYYTFELNSDFCEWIDGPFTKIVVGCNSEEELLNIEKLTLTAGLPCSLIKDAGRTEFDGVPTYTCLAIGPAKEEEIDNITGDLVLL